MEAFKYLAQSRCAKQSSLGSEWTEGNDCDVLLRLQSCQQTKTHKADARSIQASPYYYSLDGGGLLDDVDRVEPLPGALDDVDHVEPLPGALGPPSGASGTSL